MLHMNKIFLILIFSCLLAACNRTPKWTAAGSVEWDRVAILAEVSEPVLSVDVSEGDAVKAGQLLLKLDSRRAEAELRVAQSQVTQAQTHLISALRDKNRATTLRAAKMISQEAFDSTETAERVASADLESARANVEHMQLTLQRLEVHAPRDGRIDSLPYRKGDQPPLGAALVSLLVGDAPYARVYIPEPWRATVQSKQHMQVYIDGIEKPFDAIVRSIRSEASFTPYYALTGEDASRLSYRAELVLQGDNISQLSPGIPCHAEPVHNDKY